MVEIQKICALMAQSSLGITINKSVTPTSIPACDSNVVV
jgi:hypothetical protein